MKKYLSIIGIILLNMFLFAKGVNELNGTYKIVVNGYDWGPAVNKVIVMLDHEIDEIDKEMLSVVETKKWYTKTPTQSFNRTIEKAYLSDEKGNKTNGKSKNFALELYVSPNEGSPFLYSIQTHLNTWIDTYFLTIDLADKKEIKIGKDTIRKLNIDTKYTKKMMPTVEKFKMSEYSADDITLNYAYYSPKKDNKKNPLIIWLHGAGEGGKDPSIVLLGNEVTALVSEETQKMLGNAYVLAPQVETMWMDNGTGNYTTDGYSKYEKVLTVFIKDFVSKNPDIDTNKIIIGGCSNGGYMTMNMIIKNPTYFSAAYPICEAYSDKWITDEMIEKMKELPIWFTHAISDDVVNPKETTLPTYERLVRAGAKDVHISLFGRVEDTTGLYKDEKGEPHTYFGHWSWIYTLNNQSVEGKTQLFEWAASKVNKNNIK